MWQIHSWDPESQTGTVRSPHFGPWPFGAAQNPKGTLDFRVDEEVVVVLAGKPESYRVESVREVRPKPQPPGTSCPELVELNKAEFGDAAPESSSAHLWWFGDCCRWCGRYALVKFFGVSYASTFDDSMDIDRPLLRWASEDEMAEHSLTVPDNARAFCLVAVPQRPADEVAEPFFIVAESVGVEFYPAHGR